MCLFFTADLLTANDTLNVCFESYEAYQTARSAALPDAGVMSAAARAAAADVTDGPPTPNAIANSASPAVTPAAAQPVPSPERKYCTSQYVTRFIVHRATVHFNV